MGGVAPPQRIRSYDYKSWDKFDVVGVVTVPVCVLRVLCVQLVLKVYHTISNKQDFV